MTGINGDSEEVELSIVGEIGVLAFKDLNEFLESDGVHGDCGGEGFSKAGIFHHHSHHGFDVFLDPITFGVFGRDDDLRADCHRVDI